MADEQMLTGIPADRAGAVVCFTILLRVDLDILLGPALSHALSSVIRLVRKRVPNGGTFMDDTNFRAIPLKGLVQGFV
jgi:hypothetical protein